MKVIEIGDGLYGQMTPAVILCGTRSEVAEAGKLLYRENVLLVEAERQALLTELEEAVRAMLVSTDRRYKYSAERRRVVDIIFKLDALDEKCP